jgi:hypothetical protein
MTADEIGFSDGKLGIRVCDLSVTWTPWDLVCGRGFNLGEVRSQISFNLNPCAASPQRSSREEREVCTAGGWIISLKKPIRGIIPPIQWPLKLWVKKVDLKWDGTLSPERRLTGTLIGESIAPGRNGDLRWECTYRDSPTACIREASGSGTAILAQKETGKLSKIEGVGKWSIQLPNEIVTCDAFFRSERTAGNSQIQEKIILKVNAGDGNDWDVVGSVFSYGDKSVSLKWNVNFNDNFLAALTTTTPIFFLTLRGQTNLIHKTHVLDSQCQIDCCMQSVLKGEFDDNRSIVRLRGESYCQLDRGVLRLSDFHIRVNNAINDKKIFVARLEEPIEFDSTTKKIVDINKDVVIFKGSLFSLPLTLLNPIVRRRGVKIEGSINADLELAWSTAARQWNFSTTTPAKVNNLHCSVNGCPHWRDVLLKVKSSLLLNRHFDGGHVDCQVEVNDQDYRLLARTECELGWEGLRCDKLNLDNRVYIDWQAVGTQPVWAFLSAANPPKEPLKLNTHCQLSWDRSRSALEWERGVLKLNEGSRRRVNFELKQPVRWDTAAGSIVAGPDGDIAAVHVSSLSLEPISGFLQKWTRFSCSGLLNYDGQVRRKRNRWTLDSESPLMLDHFRWSAEKDWLQLDTLRCLPALEWADTVVAALSELRLECDQRVLLEGKGSCSLSKNKEWRLRAASVEARLRYDEWCMQPIFASLPPLTGDLFLNGTWSPDHMDGIAKTSVAPLDTNVVCDADLTFGGTTKNLHVDGNLRLTGPFGTSTLAVDGRGSLQSPLSPSQFNVKCGDVFMDDLLFFADWCKSFGFAFTEHARTLLPPKIKNTVPHETTIVRAPTAQPPSPRICSLPSPAPWPGFVSKIGVAVDAIHYGTSTFRNCDTRIVATPDAIEVKEPSLRWEGTAVALDARIQRKNEDYEAQCTARVDALQASSVIRLCNDIFRAPVGTKYDVVTGAFDSNFHLHARGSNTEQLLKNLRGTVHISSAGGVIEPLRQQGAMTQTVVGVAGAALSLLGQSTPTMGALDIISRYFQRIPYDVFELELSRNEDCAIRINRAFLANDSLHVSADGFVEQDPSRNPMDQPLRIVTHWNARSESMVDLFACDTTRTDALGYFLGPTCVLSGSLAHPDTSDFKKLFNYSSFPTPDVKGTTKHIGNAVKGLFEAFF